MKINVSIIENHGRYVPIRSSRFDRVGLKWSARNISFKQKDITATNTWMI